MEQYEERYAVLVLATGVPNPFKIGTKRWKALDLVLSMTGRTYPEVVAALESQEVADGKRGNPARWLRHFAGWESVESGKAVQRPFIHLILQNMTPGIIDGYHLIQNIEDLRSSLRIAGSES